MKTILHILPYENYNEKAFSIAKKLSGKSKRICYVTLNKTCMAVHESLKNNKIDIKKFYCLDSVTPNLFKKKPIANCVYVDLKDLSKFADTLLNLIKLKKIDTVVLDSLSSLLVYKPAKDVIKLLEYIVPFFEELRVNLIIFALKDDIDNPSVKQVKMMAAASR